MVHQQALEYIKQRTAQGVSKEQIENELQANGWQSGDIQTAFASHLAVPSAPSPYSPSLPGAGTLLSEAWALYTSKLSTVLTVMLVPAAVSAFPFLFVLTATHPFFFILFLPVLMFLFAFLLVLLQVWGLVALMYAISDQEGTAGVSSLFQKGLKMLLPLLWVSLLISLISFGGFLLFLVPGIILTVWFSLAGFILITENTRGMSALLRSKEYIRGSFAGTLWRLVFVGVLWIVILFPLSFLLKMAPYGDILTQILITFTLFPISVAYWFRLYHHLKTRKSETSLPEATSKQKALFITIGLAGFLVLPLALGILRGIGFKSISSANTTVNDTLRQANIRTIQVDLELQKDRTGEYPTSLSELTPSSGTIPKDPVTTASYTYTKIGADMYTLCADLETQEDICVSP